jgi:hypothetical protein
VTLGLGCILGFVRYLWKHSLMAVYFSSLSASSTLSSPLELLLLPQRRLLTRRRRPDRRATAKSRPRSRNPRRPNKVGSVR